MHQMLVLCLLIASAMIDAQESPQHLVGLLSLESNSDGDGAYNYAYESDDGIAAHQQGYQNNEDSPTAQGSFTFTAPDGQQYSISYTADENGYLPQGAHIPTPPPIPVEILKALEQNRLDEERGIFDDGKYHPEQYNNNAM